MAGRGSNYNLTTHGRTLRNRIRHSERGVALILIIFIVTLASVLVVNLSYSTYLDARISTAAQRRIQAEYLLKSALTFARVIISVDTNTGLDSPKDFWAQFYDGQIIPVEYFAINEPNVLVQLSIQPENAKLPVLPLADPDRNLFWVDAFTLFFQNWGFDSDPEEDHTGLFPNRVFDSEEMTSNLIDYQDADSDAYNKGVEGSPPIGKELFANQSIKRIEEVSSIPGFSPNRMSQILPYISVKNTTGSINLNFVTGINQIRDQVLSALDPAITEAEVQAVHEIATSDDPFSSGTGAAVETALTPAIASKLGGKLVASSDTFEIIAKVDYQTSAYFLRAYVKRQSGNKLPDIVGIEIF